MKSADEVKVFAPATVANVAVGFDVLGFAFAELGDTVSVRRVPRAGVSIVSIDSQLFPEARDLPRDPERNTATRPLLMLLESHALPDGFSGFEVRIEKGIPLGSGMGGSAASAVGAVVAANALLRDPLPRADLLPYALAGEAVASGGAAHGDNVAPCLFGGLCCYLPTDPPEVLELPVPTGLRCVLVRPRLRQDTEAQRALLSKAVALGDYVDQSAHLAAFLAACYRDDAALLRKSMRDLIIAPQRASGIPGFTKACAAALEAGAIGCSISGSGPSVFAFVKDEDEAREVQAALTETLAAHDVAADAWTGPVSSTGARIVGGEA